MLFAPATCLFPVQLRSFDLPVVIEETVACLPVFVNGFRNARWAGRARCSLTITSPTRAFGADRDTKPSCTCVRSVYAAVCRSHYHHHLRDGIFLVEKVSMRIKIVTLGTSGDVQPHVVLGLGLQRAGHMVRLITDSSFAAALSDIIAFSRI